MQAGRIETCAPIRRIGHRKRRPLWRYTLRLIERMRSKKLWRALSKSLRKAAGQRKRLSGPDRKLLHVTKAAHLPLRRLRSSSELTEDAAGGGENVGAGGDTSDTEAAKPAIAEFPPDAPVSTQVDA